MTDLSPRAERELEGVHPALVAVVRRAFELTEDDYEVIDGLRTLAEQRNYVRRGVSKTLKSFHLMQADGYGHAVDIVPMVNGVPKWPDAYEPWKDIERAMKQAGQELDVPLTWGGDWKNRWDKPHWQIPRVFTWKGHGAPVTQPRNDNSGAFEEALAHVLKHEGGYADHPRDPGGATNMGITHHTLSRWRKRKVTKAEVKALTQDEAASIYEAFYWDALLCDDMPRGVDYAVFDFGVNSGIGRSAKFVQAIVGTEQDGRIGPITLRALDAYLADKGRQAFITKISANRLAYLKGLKTWRTFGKGWSRRVREMQAVALEMANRDAETETPRENKMSFLSFLGPLFGSVLGAMFPGKATGDKPENKIVGLFRGLFGLFTGDAAADESGLFGLIGKIIPGLQNLTEGGEGLGDLLSGGNNWTLVIVLFFLQMVVGNMAEKKPEN